MSTGRVAVCTRLEWKDVVDAIDGRHTATLGLLLRLVRECAVFQGQPREFRVDAVQDERPDEVVEMAEALDAGAVFAQSLSPLETEYIDWREWETSVLSETYRSICTTNGDAVLGALAPLLDAYDDWTIIDNTIGAKKKGGNGVAHVLRSLMLEFRPSRVTVRTTWGYRPYDYSKTKTELDVMREDCDGLMKVLGCWSHGYQPQIEVKALRHGGWMHDRLFGFGTDPLLPSRVVSVGCGLGAFRTRATTRMETLSLLAPEGFQKTAEMFDDRWRSRRIGKEASTELASSIGYGFQLQWKKGGLQLHAPWAYR